MPSAETKKYLDLKFDTRYQGLSQQARRKLVPPSSDKTTEEVNSVVLLLVVCHPAPLGRAGHEVAGWGGSIDGK